MQKTVFYVEAGSFLKSLNEFVKVLLSIRTNTNWVKSFDCKTCSSACFGVFKKCSLEKKCSGPCCDLLHHDLYTNLRLWFMWRTWWTLLFSQLDWSPSHEDLEQCSMKGKKMVSVLFECMNKYFEPVQLQIYKANETKVPIMYQLAVTVAFDVPWECLKLNQQVLV